MEEVVELVNESRKINKLAKRGRNRCIQLREIRSDSRKLLFKFCEFRLIFRRSCFCSRRLFILEREAKVRNTLPHVLFMTLENPVIITDRHQQVI